MHSRELARTRVILQLCGAQRGEVTLSRFLPSRDAFCSGQQPLLQAAAIAGVMAGTVVNGVTENIDDVTRMLQSGSELLRAAREFGAEAVTTVDQALAVLEAYNVAETELNYEVKTSIHHLVLVTEKAIDFLNKVTDVFWYGKNDELLEDARRGVCASPSNPEPLRVFLSQLKRSLQQANESYSAFEAASNTARCNFTIKAKNCAKKVAKSRNRKITTKIAGGTTSGVAIGTGVIAVGGAGTIATVGTVVSIAVGIPTLGLGTLVGLLATAAGTAAFGTAVVGAGVAGGVATHLIAKNFEEIESSCRNLQGHFNSLLSCAHEVRELMAEIDSKMKQASTQMDHISICMEDGRNMVLLQVALSRLQEVCAESHDTTKPISAQLRDRLQDLKLKLNEQDD